MAFITPAARLFNISGRQIVRLMCRYKVTIRELKARMNITLKRIREVREAGLDDACTALDWVEFITGDKIGMFIRDPLTGDVSWDRVRYWLRQRLPSEA